MDRTRPGSRTPSRTPPPSARTREHEDAAAASAPPAPAPGPAMVLLLSVVGFLIVPDRFLQACNLSLIIQQVMVVGTLAIGQTIIILTAGVDLSVGAITISRRRSWASCRRMRGFPGCRAAARLRFRSGRGHAQRPPDHPPTLPPFIVTLGTLNIFFALALYISRSQTIRGRTWTPCC